jgi:hypothetical protein
MKRRFVFLFFAPGNMYSDGQDVEIRALDLGEALVKAAQFCKELHATDCRLIGERRGFKSDQRFFAMSPEVPEHIRQNERVVELMKEVA